MKPRKMMMAGLITIGVCCSLCLPITSVRGMSYVTQGVYQLTVPTGSREWTVSLTAAREYEITLGLFTPGHANFVLTMVDPWAQDYTFVSLEFWHSETSDDVYTSTFTAPLSGQYIFTLASSGGTEQALQIYFAILDTGRIYNVNTYEGLPLADAHACNLSHAVWSYYVSLEGCATYFIDVARGDPSGVEVPIVVNAKVQAMNGLEIPILMDTLLPWEAPECNKTQVMEWAGDWFGVSTSTTYNLVVEVSGLVSLDPVVVAITVSKEQQHGSSTLPDDDTPGNDTGNAGLEIGLEGVMVVGGPCAVALCIVAIAVVGTKRKRAVRGTAGVVKRDIPVEGW